MGIKGRLTKEKMGYAMPVDAPAYAPPPGYFKGARFLRFDYETDEESVSQIIPEQLTLTDNLDVLTLLADDNTLTNQSSVSSSQGLTLKNANNGMSLIAAGQLNSTSTSSMSFIATGNVDISSGAANTVRIGDPSGTLASSVRIGAQNVVSIESDNNNVNILANNGAVNIGNSGGDETNSILMATDGNITLDFNSGGHVTSNGAYRNQNGVTANPAYSFNNDPDTGFYLEVAGRSAIAAGGANVIQAWATGVKLSQPLLLQNAALPGANTYEEFTAFEYGTFTPLLTGNNVGADLDASYDVQVGKYLRINNIIYGWFDIRLTSINDNLNYTQPSGLVIQANAINGGAQTLFQTYTPAVPAAAVATQVSGGEVNISFKSGFNVLDRFFLPTSGYISSASGKEIVLQVFSNEVTNVSGIDRLNLSMTAATAINTFPGSPAQGAASNARIAGTFSYIFETP